MSLWDNNAIQYPRFIDEINAAGVFTPEVVKTICDSMDITEAQLDELLGRAEKDWESIKAIIPR